MEERSNFSENLVVLYNEKKIERQINNLNY